MMRMIEIRFYAIIALISLVLKNQYFYMKLYEMSVFWNIISLICFFYIAVLWITSLFTHKDDENNEPNDNKDNKGNKDK